MRILITGGMGFIGHNVAVRLAKHGHAISVIDCYQPYHDNDRRYLVSEREKKIESVINPRVNGRPITLYQNYYYVLPIQTSFKRSSESQLQSSSPKSSKLSITS